ncbi:MAG TPA: polymer-forming cytoskeletal protein [Vicinamibacterales bacterium]|nr:polymer-forming cytoskeletal protein [Vicinamibacterales bacterium]
MTYRRVSIGLIVAVILAAPSVLAIGLAGASPTGPQPRERDDRQIVITGRVDVESQETVEDVFILNGDVRIAGRVDGSVFAVNGDVTVSGSVRHGVHAINGRVVLSENARVGGDVTSRDKARIAPGARVDGDVESPGRRFAAGRIGAVPALGVWLAITVSTLVLGLLLLLIAPRAADAFSDAGRTATWASIGLGIAFAIGLPIVGFLLLASLIGLPLGAVVLLALGLLYTLGYVASAYFLGRLILKPPRGRVLAYVVGWAILSVVGLIPVVNVIVLIAATVFGIGMIVVATFRARWVSPEPAPTDAGRPAASRLRD